jgi:hypothetical protein
LRPGAVGPRVRADAGLAWGRRRPPKVVNVDTVPDPEEQFSEVVILARDGVATLDASYRFLEDGRVTNHGREVWTLVETADGWKIGSVTWSVIID